VDHQAPAPFHISRPPSRETSQRRRAQYHDQSSAVSAPVCPLHVCRTSPPGNSVTTLTHIAAAAATPVNYYLYDTLKLWY